MQYVIDGSMNDGSMGAGGDWDVIYEFGEKSEEYKFFKVDKGLRPEFSPTHHPYIFVDCIKIQLEKQWDNCNCILIQR